MKNRTPKIAFSVFLCVLLCVLAVMPVFANSAQSYWEGVSASGVLTTEGECPLVAQVQSNHVWTDQHLGLPTIEYG